MDYTPKNILLCGGAGFIGSHVLNILVKKYPSYRFYNLDKLDYCASLKRLEPIKECSNYNFIHGDICSTDLVNHIIREHEIDTIINYAAQTHVDNSFGNSLTFTQNNIVGTHNLLECAKKNHIKRFIHISTDEVYGSIGDIAAHEGTILDPTNPYSASKAAAEMLVRSYAHSFNLPIIITRSNNIYGPNQFPEKIIPKFVDQLLDGRKITIHGNGQNQRSFLHVEDVVRAFDIILHKGSLSTVYNIGSNNEIKNIDLARKIAKHLNMEPSENIEYVEDRCFNDHRYFISSEAVKNLGWKEEIAFEDGLVETINWCVKNQGFFTSDST